mgnify:CR=1 FL=1
MYFETVFLTRWAFWPVHQKSEFLAQNYLFQGKENQVYYPNPGPGSHEKKLHPAAAATAHLNNQSRDWLSSLRCAIYITALLCARKAKLYRLQ